MVLCTFMFYQRQRKVHKSFLVCVKKVEGHQRQVSIHYTVHVKTIIGRSIVEKKEIFDGIV